MATRKSHHSADLSTRASMLIWQLLEDHDPRQGPKKLRIEAVNLASTITILLENGFTHKDLGARALGCAAKYLQDQLRRGSGETGLAADTEPDADSTAKAISALCLLGQPPSPEGLIVQFEDQVHFKTYTHDRNPRFSTNCHVFKALLDLLPSNSKHMYQIEKAVKFICDYWWMSSGPINDRSHTSEIYPIMLMVEAFTRLMQLWQDGHAILPDDPSIRDRVVISLFQALTKILRTQIADGSWENGDSEVTSYALISLAKLTLLSSSPKIRSQVSRAIESGRRFLTSDIRASKASDSVWRGSFTSGSALMHEALLLAVQNANVQKKQTGTPIESYMDIPLAKITIQTKYYARQAWFASVPEWLVQACLIETHLFLPRIRGIRYSISPRDCAIDDRYFESIPFAFIVANNLDNRNVGPEIVHHMTTLTILTRQFDGYMDRVVSGVSAERVSEVEHIVHDIFTELATEKKIYGSGHTRDAGASGPSTSPTTSDVRSVLHRFISHVLHHPCVLRATPHDKAQLRSELQSFLVSRVNQLSGEQEGSSPNDQTPHLYTFAFLACLVGQQRSGNNTGPKGDFLESPEQQYLAADLCRHMSIISFISKNADDHQAALVKPTQTQMEDHIVGGRYTPSNLSSLSLTTTSSSSYEDSQSPVSPLSSISSTLSSSPIENVFPRSSSHSRSSSLDSPSQETMQMARLLSHERRCLNMSFEGLLVAGITEATANIIKFLVDFNDLAEQIYRDPNIGSSCQPGADQDDTEEACVLPPPVPPKRTRGLVTTAQAALSVETNTSQQMHQQRPDTQQQAQNDRQTFPAVHTPSTPSHTPTERNWSWHKPPSIPNRHASHPSIEINRIETIMSEIDGVKLQFESKPKPGIPLTPQRRTASESQATFPPFQSQINNTHRRLTSLSTPDAEGVKLAKVREETQRRIWLEAERKNAKAAHSKVANGFHPNTVISIKDSEAKSRSIRKQEWIKVPPAECLESLEVRGKKLRRAGRLGGPRWKAPF